MFIEISNNNNIMIHIVMNIYMYIFEIQCNNSNFFFEKNNSKSTDK